MHFERIFNFLSSLFGVNVNFNPIRPGGGGAVTYLRITVPMQYERAEKT